MITVDSLGTIGTTESKRAMMKITKTNHHRADISPNHSVRPFTTSNTPEAIIVAKTSA